MASDAAVSKEGLLIPTAGFIYLKNHSVPLDDLKHAFSTSARFFDQPLDDKLDLGWTTPEANRGYSAPGREKVTQLKEIDDVEKVRAAAPDLKESYEIGREGVDGLPNQWPKDGAVPDFRTDMLGFFDQCKELHVEVMRAIAVGMGLDEEFFDRYVDVGDNTLRLLHYPEIKSEIFKINPGAVRAGEHSVSHDIEQGRPVEIANLARTTDPSLCFSKTTAVVCKSRVQMGSLSMPPPSKAPLSSTPVICLRDGAMTPSRAPSTALSSRPGKQTKPTPHDTASRK
ncbi:hypothetical protein AUP68_13255 [Ilyonectria robusta]